MKVKTTRGDIVSIRNIGIKCATLENPVNTVYYIIGEILNVFPYNSDICSEIVLGKTFDEKKAFKIVSDLNNSIRQFVLGNNSKDYVFEMPEN